MCKVLAGIAAASAATVVAMTSMGCLKPTEVTIPEDTSVFEETSYADSVYFEIYGGRLNTAALPIDSIDKIVSNGSGSLLFMKLDGSHGGIAPISQSDASPMSMKFIQIDVQ